MTHADDSWGPWIEHDGKGCPCVGRHVMIERMMGGIEYVIAGSEAMAKGFSPNESPSAWVHVAYRYCNNDFVRRYRIRKPRGMAVLDAIMADPLRAPAKEGVE